MALWTKKKLTGIVPAELEKVPPFVLLILQFNITFALQDSEIERLRDSLDSMDCQPVRLV